MTAVVMPRDPGGSSDMVAIGSPCLGSGMGRTGSLGEGRRWRGAGRGGGAPAGGHQRQEGQLLRGGGGAGGAAHLPGPRIRHRRPATGPGAPPSPRIPTPIYPSYPGRLSGPGRLARMYKPLSMTCFALPVLTRVCTSPTARPFHTSAVGKPGTSRPRSGVPAPLQSDQDAELWKERRRLWRRRAPWGGVRRGGAGGGGGGVQMGTMAGESGAAAAQLHRLSTRRDNLAALVARLSVLDGLLAGTAALNLLLEAPPPPLPSAPPLVRRLRLPPTSHCAPVPASRPGRSVLHPHAPPCRPVLSRRTSCGPSRRVTGRPVLCSTAGSLCGRASQVATHHSVVAAPAPPGGTHPGCLSRPHLCWRGAWR